MAETPQDLLDSVNDQAQARVEMNVQGYSKYLTPAAIDSLRASFPGIPPRVNRYEIASQAEEGSAHVIEIRYFSRDEAFVVRSRWGKEGDDWKVLHAERLWEEGQKKPGPVSRVLGSVVRFLARFRR
jgi:hypothetical protein